MGHSNHTAEQHYGKSTLCHWMGNTYMAQVKQFGTKWQAFLLGTNQQLQVQEQPLSGKPTVIVTNDNATMEMPSTYLVNHTTNNVYNINIASTNTTNALRQVHGAAGISSWSEKRLHQIYQAIQDQSMHHTPFQNKDFKQCFNTVWSTSPGDFICILPTGLGKSFIYQYVAIANLQQEQDVVVVIIPLKELLENQIVVSRQLRLPFV